MGPYNCRYERIGSTSYLMCSECNRVREIDLAPEKVRDLCPVLLMGAPDVSAGAKSVSALVTAPRTTQKPTGNLFGFDNKQVAMLGLEDLGLGEKHNVSVDNDCLVASFGEYEFTICYDTVRQLAWASLRIGEGDDYKSIRWSRDDISQSDIDDAVVGGAPIVLLYESNEGFEVDLSNSMVIIPAV